MRIDKKKTDFDNWSQFFTQKTHALSKEMRNETRLNSTNDRERGHTSNRKPKLKLKLKQNNWHKVNELFEGSFEMHM